VVGCRRGDLSKGGICPVFAVECRRWYPCVFSYHDYVYLFRTVISRKAEKIGASLSRLSFEPRFPPFPLLVDLKPKFLDD